MTRLLVALGCLVWLPRVLYAQADTTALGVRFRFEQPPLSLQQPAMLRASWMGGPRVPSGLRLAAIRQPGRRLGGRPARRPAAGVPDEGPVRGGRPAQEVEDSADRPRHRNVLGLPTKYADLSLDGQARLEIRTDRVHEGHCTPALLADPNSGCRGGFKAPSLDNEINIRSTGLLAQRVHVNVDLDTQRDYTSNQNIQIYYEGLQDEIVRRVDVGTVVFQPPPSRFLTAAVPANNFGVNATFEVGPVQLQTLAATQKGSVVAQRTYTVGQTTSQAQDRQARDLDFESGRFFWVIDPVSSARVSGHRHPQRRRGASALSPTDRPSPGAGLPVPGLREQERRQSQSGRDHRAGQPPATAPSVRAGALGAAGPGCRLLSGSVRAVGRLGTKLDQNDFLAVSYRDHRRPTVGTFPEVDQDAGGRRRRAEPDTLEPDRPAPAGADPPTFRYEMRQVYRVAGADLDLRPCGSGSPSTAASGR